MVNQAHSKKRLSKKVIGNLILGCLILQALGVTYLGNGMGMAPLGSNRQTEKIYSAGSEEIAYLIITTSEFAPSLQKLANLKTQKALPARIISISEIAANYSGVDLPAKMKNCILDYYTNHNTTWVLLGGDEQYIPSRNAYAPEDYPNDGNVVSCDTYYSDLDNDWDLDQDGIWGELGQDNYDYHAEVFVGRLCATTYGEMEHLVDNIVQYETSPPIGDWIGRALYAGSMLFFAEDWDDDDVVDYLEDDYNRFDHFVNQTMSTSMDVNWSTQFLAEAEGLAPSQYYYDTPLTEENLVNSLNQGHSMGIICGHGNPSLMVRSLFSQDLDSDGLLDRDGSLYEGGTLIDSTDSRPLINIQSNLNHSQQKLGFYYLGGCSVGTFTAPEDCLAEYFLKTTAIGCIAASQVVWGEDEWFEREHGGWYSEGLTFRFWEQFTQTNRPGQALAYAKADYIDDRNNPAYWNASRPYFPDWENKTLKQFNLFGDPEIPIWLTLPQNFEVNQNETNGEIAVVVNSSRGLEPNVSVVVSDQDLILWKGITNSSGEVAIPYNLTQLSTLDLTYYKEGYLPVQFLNSPPKIFPEDSTDDSIDDSTDDTTDDSADDATDDSNKFKIPGFSQLPVYSILGLMMVGLVFLQKRRQTEF